MLINRFSWKSWKFIRHLSTLIQSRPDWDGWNSFMIFTPLLLSCCNHWLLKFLLPPLPNVMFRPDKTAFRDYWDTGWERLCTVGERSSFSDLWSKDVPSIPLWKIYFGYRPQASIDNSWSKAHPSLCFHIHAASSSLFVHVELGTQTVLVQLIALSQHCTASFKDLHTIGCSHRNTGGCSVHLYIHGHHSNQAGCTLSMVANMYVHPILVFWFKIWYLATFIWLIWLPIHYLTQNLL